MEHYVGSDTTNSLCLLQMWRMLRQVGNVSLPLPTSTAATATTAPGADENNNYPDDTHEYVNTVLIYIFNVQNNF